MSINFSDGSLFLPLPSQTIFHDGCIIYSHTRIYIISVHNICEMSHTINELSVSLFVLTRNGRKITKGRLNRNLILGSGRLFDRLTEKCYMLGMCYSGGMDAESCE